MKKIEKTNFSHRPKILFKEFNSSFNEELINNDLVANIQTHINSDYFYHNGYFNAGEIIYKNWFNAYKKEGDNISVDSIIYPIYYCYRQSVEIYIKKILRTLGVEFEKNHNIEKLYLQLKEKLSENEKVDIIDNFINVLSDNDSSFTRFRYDVKKNGEPYEIISVDIIGMVNGFKNTYYFFDNIWKTKFKEDLSFQHNHYNRFLAQIPPK